MGIDNIKRRALYFSHTVVRDAGAYSQEDFATDVTWFRTQVQSIDGTINSSLHWNTFGHLPDQIEHAVKDDKGRMRYAYLGVLAAFSRDLTDPFTNADSLLFRGPFAQRVILMPEFDYLRKYGNTVCHEL